MAGFSRRRFLAYASAGAALPSLRNWTGPLHRRIRCPRLGLEAIAAKLGPCSHSAALPTAVDRESRDFGEGRIPTIPVDVRPHRGLGLTVHPIESLKRLTCSEARRVSRSSRTMSRKLLTRLNRKRPRITQLMPSA